MSDESSHLYPAPVCGQLRFLEGAGTGYAKLYLVLDVKSQYCDGFPGLVTILRDGRIEWQNSDIIQQLDPVVSDVD